MTNRYNEIMERIQLTSEMHSRVIDRIHRENFAKRSIRHAFSYRRYMAAAAAVAVLIGAAAIYPLLHQEPQNPDGGGENDTTVSSFAPVEVSSLSELSEAVGFLVPEIENLPFKVIKIVYVDTFGMADITYTGEDNEAFFRMGEGTEDISGDYTEYQEETAMENGAYSVTLKGESNSYKLAIWTDGTYSYCLSLQKGVSVETWKEMLAQFQ